MDGAGRQNYKQKGNPEEGKKQEEKERRMTGIGKRKKNMTKYIVLKKLKQQKELVSKEEKTIQQFLDLHLYLNFENSSEELTMLNQNQSH